MCGLRVSKLTRIFIWFLFFDTCLCEVLFKIVFIFIYFLGGRGSRCLLHCPTENSTYCWRGEGAKVSVLPGFPQLARSKSDSKTTDARSVRHFSLQFRSHKSSAEAAECVKVTQLVAAPRTRNYWGSAK